MDDFEPTYLASLEHLAQRRSRFTRRHTATGWRKSWRQPSPAHHTPEQVARALAILDRLTRPVDDSRDDS